ncbi:MAG TPA: hypothetical protein VL381_04350, partial [Rhodocyclaceae bacterium]|nr:hypothetical protein [Rhodocyclaceae bacterium]
MIRARYSLYKQRGATLLVSLLMLILIMILGVTAMNSSTIQAMLSGNLQFADVAMNQSEAALNTGENWLRSGTNAQNGGFAIYNSTGLRWVYPAPVNDPLTMV